MSQSRRKEPQRERSAQENLDLGHARLRSECWAALRPSALRLPRRARKRTRLHLTRPSAPAEARFTSRQAEFLHSPPDG